MPADAGRITAQIDGDISGLKTALGQARSEATSAVSGIEGSFRSNLGSGLKDSMSGIASSMGPIGGALSAIGPAGIAAGAGIAVVGSALSSSVAVAGQFQQTMSGVAAVAGATAPQLELMATAARDAGASSVFSASQAAEAMGFLASSGMSVENTIATLEPTLMMAAAGGLGLAEAGDLMAGSLAQFGLAATDATSVADTLAAGAAASNASVTQLGQGLQNVGPMAASVGMSLQETTAALGVFANSNIKGAEAGTALKSMIASLLGPTKTAAAAFAEMGISADQVNPSLRSYDEIMSTLKGSHMTAQQAVAIFGKEMAANALVAVNGADSYDELLTKVSETGKASEMAKTQTDNYAGAMSEFSGAIEEAQITLGTAFLPVLTDVTQALTTGVRAGLEFADSISSTVGGITAAFSEAASGGSLADIDDAFLSALGVDTGKEAGDQLAEGIAESDDLKEAPGEALGSPAALAGAGEAGKTAAETWVESFGDAAEKGMVNIGGEWMSASWTRAVEKTEREFEYLGKKWGSIAKEGGSDLRTWYLDGVLVGSTTEAMTPVESFMAATGMAPPEEGTAAYFGMMGEYGKAALAKLQEELSSDVADSYLDVAANTKSEVETSGQNIADAFAKGLVPDSAQIDASLDALRHLQLYDPEEAKAQGAENAIVYLGALKDAIEAYDEAKAKYLVEPDNARALEDLKRTRDNLQTQLAQNPLTVKVKAEWGQFDTKSLSELIFDPAAMQAAAANPEKFFTGTIVPGIQDGMAAAKAAIATGQITEDDVYEAFIKPLESASDYLPSWLDNLNTLFRNGFIGFDEYAQKFDAFMGTSAKVDAALANTAQATKTASVGYNQLQKAVEDCESCLMSDFGAWQEAQENLFNPSYIGQGGQAYLDWKNTVVSAANEASMAMAAVGGAALGSVAQPKSIPVAVTLDTSAATSALTAFESTAKKDVQKPVTIDSAAATASLSEIDSTAKQPANKPLIIDTSQAMSAISAINAAAGAPVYKTVYVSEVYTGSSGGSSGGSGGGGSLGNYQLPPIFMARGGYVDRPTLAVVGEAGPEVVTPLSDMPKVFGGGGINITINSPIHGGNNADIEALLAQRNREIVAEITQQISEARRGL